MAAHRIPYAATATVGYPLDLVEKVRRARAVRGTRFLHILSPCPPGWKYPHEATIELSRMAVRCRIFPRVEVEYGQRWRLSFDPAPPEPVGPYLRKPGRFRHLAGPDVAYIQREVDARWDMIVRLERESNGALADWEPAAANGVGGESLGLQV